MSVTKTQNSSNAQEWRLAFQGGLAGTDVPQTTVDSTSVSTMGGGPTNIQATDAAGGTFNETQVIELEATTGGQFRLSFNGELSGPLNYNATAAEVDTVLEALSGIDQVTVTGNAGGPWTVTFGGTQSGMNQPQLGGDPTTLSNGTLVRTISYTLDAASQLTSVSDPDSEYAFTYDHLGRLLTVDNDDTPNLPHVVLTSAYDAVGNRTSLSANLTSTADLKNTYTFDALNRLT